MSGISIAMTTCNGERFVEAQLASLAAQRRLPSELVVCDDASTDATGDLVRRFASTAPFPVRLRVNPSRLGWRANFVQAAGLCACELIAFCDQDDLWYPDKLAAMVDEFADPDVLLVFHNADLVDEHGSPYGTLLPIAATRERIGAMTRPTLWSNPLGLTMMFRRWLTRYNDLWEGSADLASAGQRAAHDQWFYYLATNLGPVISLPQRLLAYRQHGNNSVGWNVAPTPSGSESRVDDIRDQLHRSVAMLRPFCAAMEQAAQREEGDLALRFSKAAAKNKRLLARCERRLALYQASGWIARAGHALGLFAHRSYGQGSDWGLGWRAGITDVCVGVPSGRSRSSKHRSGGAPDQR